MKKVLYIIIAAMALVALVGVIVMISISDAKNVLRDITPTDAVIEAYKSGGEILTHDPDQELSFDGYMRCYALVYIPGAKELQITVKSNRSAFEKLETTEEQGYIFLLYNTETEEENKNCTVTSEFEGRYAYYRIVFGDVEFSDTASLELVMLSPNNAERGSVAKIHKSGQEFAKYKLSKEEIASMGD